MKGPRERRSIDIAGVFDIETESWDRFVVGGILWRDGGELLYRDYDFRKEDHLVDAILSTEGTIYAHFGGRFDFLWLLEHIARRELKGAIGMQGSRIARLAIGKTVIRDSFSLMPMKLRDIAAIGGEEKAETGLECECGEACGGYCAIHRGMSRDKFNRLRAYLEQDCRALYGALCGLRDYAEEKDLDLAGTVGMSAWLTLQRWLGIPDVDWGEGSSKFERYRLARSGYYGGRTQVFQPICERGYRYDINSAYPAALSKTSLPVGQAIVKNGPDASRAFDQGREGIFVASVRLDDSCHVPLLPIRTEERSAYPVGSFCGAWTGLELRKALALGYSITGIKRAIYWPKAEKIIAPFFEKAWGYRAALGKSHPIGKWLKWFLNSCTGKFAQRPEHELIILRPDSPRACPAKFKCRGIHPAQGCCIHECSGACGKWAALDAEGYVWRRAAWRMSPCGYVHWAAYLTGATRIELHRQLTDDGQDGRTAVYCDTDSCYASAPRDNNVGEELGQWNREGTFEPFYDAEQGGEQPGFFALAPKTYRYFDGQKQHARSKGIPKALENWPAIAGRRDVSIDRGVRSFKTAVVKGKFFVRMEMHRRIKADGVHFGDRILEGNLTRPPRAEELRG